MADGLKLTALDADDLAVVSAQVQDAVVRAGQLQFLPRKQKFIATLSRFDWLAYQVAGELIRRQCVLQFNRVQSVKARAIPQGEADYALALLSVTFEAGQAPSGAITLSFAGGGTIRLVVECIEASLADMDAAWAAQSAPQHPERKA
jgi:hypothetical protein